GPPPPPGPPPARAPAAGAPSRRPAPASRGRSAASLSAAERRRTRGPRVLVITALLLVLAVFLLPSWQKWLEQRSEIGRLEATIGQQQEDLAAMRAEQARWADDAYVRTQARARLQYVVPGETPYVVDSQRETDAVPPAEAAASVPRSSAAWYENIWDSLRVAGVSDPSSAPDAPSLEPVPAPTLDGE
ncbi:FtsB family cell division protein, partial [Kineococcus sp. SYSU DK004]|uniref:FtsB family cell division protein n=1 Tax=Kineococcus sp. SYSU DK004 TaxID=3383125 RepID=UPI003D7C3AF3